MAPFVLALALVGGLVFASPGEAQVVRVEILSKEPANGGQPRIVASADSLSAYDFNSTTCAGPVP